ncbi:hypothetical protein MJO47_14615 [Desulfuromonas sp. KJ2020]|uniref:hypothetical protein n=1 Tax=Desulfuromonas sp. KJ2020 TaxID=2919173 RepID=UPI0020A81B88|nr:hypothetical protein [Desulfuromonas sp. KJ2020]MCP3178335.1 hypothetical protein [Desulfuromonas sp. KJ2020]
MPAGDNEITFGNIMRSKFGNTCLNGKRVFNLKIPGHDKVTISVDQSIILKDGRTVLIEIDSANMAKLVSGQYALLNGMYDNDRSKCLFLVLHYYVAYNPKRTIKNLKAIQHFNENSEWIPFAAYHIIEFEKLIDSVDSLEELVDKIWPNN